MILDNVLNAQWTPYGVKCNSALEAKQIHKFLREAVLDRHICLHKAIGFKVNSNVAYRSYVGTYIARHMQLGESYPQMVVNLLDKVFLNVNANSAKCLLNTGSNTLDKVSFGDGRSKTYDVLYTDSELCRCLYDSTYFTVKLKYDCGFHSMDENSKELPSDYFPCYTDYSLTDYVRVLPMGDDVNIVPIRFYNGMTVEKFLDILKEWRVYINTGCLRKEDALWLQRNYAH